MWSHVAKPAFAPQYGLSIQQQTHMCCDVAYNAQNQPYTKRSYLFSLMHTIKDGSAGMILS